MIACREHQERIAECPSCHALNSSVATRTLQADLDEVRRAFNFEELIREIEAHCRGDVEA